MVCNSVNDIGIAFMRMSCPHRPKNSKIRQLKEDGVFFFVQSFELRNNFPHVHMLQTPWCYFHLPQQEPYLYSMSGNEVEVKVDSNATIFFHSSLVLTTYSQ